MTAPAKRLALTAAAALLLAGCSALKSAPQVRTFRMTYRPPQASGAPPLPVTVRVLPFGIVSAYDRQTFLYRSGPYDVGIDYYNQWVGNPAHMITDLIARDLAASKAVRAVFQEPSAVPSNYELSGTIETLEERDDDGGCLGHLRLRVLVIRVPPQGARYVVFQDNVTADSPCTPGDPASYAAAMSRAVEQVSDTVRSQMLSAIAAASSKEYHPSPQRRRDAEPSEFGSE